MNELNALRKHDADADILLSALYDGELDPEAAKRALARLGRDDEALGRWSEYSLIGDVMRGCAPGRADFAARVRAAVADEPTVLAPLPAATDRRPYYYAAAAAAVAAIAWGVLSMSPQSGETPALPVAANDAPLAQNDELRPYLAAHQDYAYAVAGDTEMRFTQVSLAGGGR